MNIASKTSFVLHQRHLLGIEGLSHDEITGLLDLAGEFVDLNRQIEKKRASLRGRTIWATQSFDTTRPAKKAFHKELMSAAVV